MRGRTVAGVLLAASVSLLLTLARAERAHAQSPQDPSCSIATAEQVAARDNPFYGSFDPGVERIHQVLCGAFAGRGSNAMAVSFTAATCWTPQQWAVYAYDAGAWARIKMVNSWLSQPLVAIGSRIHEVVPVFNERDPRCIPSGGERWRVWHWSGERLVAHRWHRVKVHVLFWAGGFITCEIRDDGSDPGSWAYCWKGARGRARHARLDVDGSVDSTHRQRLPTGLGGPTPPRGASIKTARFRCTSTRRGMRCIVRKTGAGLLFDKRGRAHRIARHRSSSTASSERARNPGRRAREH